MAASLTDEWRIATALSGHASETCQDSIAQTRRACGVAAALERCIKCAQHAMWNLLHNENKLWLCAHYCKSVAIRSMPHDIWQTENNLIVMHQVMCRPNTHITLKILIVSRGPTEHCALIAAFSFLSNAQPALCSASSIWQFFVMAPATAPCLLCSTAPIYVPWLHKAQPS